MKKILAAVLILTLLLGCASAEALRVAALKGPTAMGMVKMMSDDGGENYAFDIHAAADEITPKLVQGALDVAALPANLAAVLYNRTGGELQVLAVNTLGVLYIAERGDSIHAVSDLKGRTIYSAGKGSTPEYALNYILRQNGLEPGVDVTIEYKSEHAECLAALMSDESACAMLPQPFLTTAMTKADDMRMALDLTEEWDKLQAEGGSAMITGVVVARRAAVEENPEAIDMFLADYAESVAYTNSDVSGAAALIGQYDIVTAEVAEAALPACNIVCITGREMQNKLSGYLEVLFEQDSESVGGTLPDAQFYYVPEN
ncbi:MAG: PhnD/SsuA/transferrin family substrate-binding protein [Clostridia bacterium]|nr:PhnD/SsuA/transferrin family substrate-binding protein [Clostridia bacterium]